MIYLSGHKLLEDTDNRLNWNLLTGTNQKLKTITIPKGEDYPGVYQRGDWRATPMYNGLATYSIYVINTSSKYSLSIHAESNDAITNVIAPNSSGRLYVIGTNIKGIFFYPAINGNRVRVDEEMNFQIKEEKLEPGSIATPWMPSLSDLVFKNQNGEG